MPTVRSRTTGIAAAIALTLGVGLLPTAAHAADPPPAPQPSGQLALTGDVSVHDPTLAYDEASGLYILAGSHNSIRTAPTMNGPWSVVGSVSRAEWTHSVPNSTTLWAPHLQKIGDTFYYYYSQSSFGSSTSAIGVKTTKTPAIPSSYVDLGRPIVTSGALNPDQGDIEFNAIDPALIQDAEGAWWMTWGSFWDGIVVQKLGADLVSLVGEPTLIASRQADDNPVEGPALFYRDGYYYLVVSWDRCCAGASSTYKVAVGRSTNITGPYVDQSGVRLDEGGGSVILDTRQSAPGVTPAGLYRAPGGADVYTEDGVTYLAYHAYRPANTLGIRPMEWRDGWPYFSEPEGSYHHADGSTVRLVSEAKPFEMPDIGRVAGPSAPFGSALQLNGGSSTAYVEMPDGILSEVDGDFTIAMWVKRGSTTGNDWARLFDFGDSTENFFFMSPASAAAPTGLRVDVRLADGRGATLPGSGDSVRIGTSWTHVAVSASGTTGKLWVNGSVVRETQGFTLRPADLGFTSNNWLGRSQFSADPWLNASLDDVNIFSRELSAGEMQSLTLAAGGGESIGGGDIAWYRFDEAGGSAVIDASPSGNDARAVVPVTTEDQLQNPTPGTQCLTAEGSSIVQSDCVDASPAQTWRLDAADDGTHRLAAYGSREQECITLLEGAPGTPLVLSACNPDDARQRWFIEDTGHGFLRFSSALENLAIEIQNAGGVIDTSVVSATRAIRPIANLAPAQQWQLEHVQPPALPLDVTAEGYTRCFAGKAVIVVRTTNNDSVAVAVTLRSPFGSKQVTSLQAGASVSQSFSTRMPAVDSGAVNLEISAPEGDDRSLTAAYPAASCG